MKPQTDIYRLDAQPMTSRYGIAFGQFETDGPFYFQFIGGGGQPLFHSQGYQHQKSCENGIRSVIENAPKPERYEEKKDEKGLYLSLKAGNHQEIARSGYLKNEAEIQKLRGLMQAIGEQVPVFNWAEAFAERQEKAPETEVAETKAAPPAELPVAVKKIEPANRIRFEVSVYSEPKRIKIENNFSQESKVLSGLNGEEIADFIHSELSSELRREFPIIRPKPAPVKLPSTPPSSAQIQAELDELPAPFEADGFGKSGVEKLKSRYQPISNEIPNPVATQPKPSLQEKEDVVMAFIAETGDTAPEMASSASEIRKMLREMGNGPQPETSSSPVEKLLATAGRSLPTEPGEDRVNRFIRSGKNPETFAAKPENKEGGKADASFLSEAKKNDEKRNDVVEEFIGRKVPNAGMEPASSKGASPKGIGCACV